MEEKTIAPIQTYYNGYHFRSRLEARWAVFFDAAGIKYEYEPEGFKVEIAENEVYRYLPDFYLPDFDVYTEVKPNKAKLLEDSAKLANMIDYEGPLAKGLIILGQIPYYEERNCVIPAFTFLYYHEGICSGLCEFILEGGYKLLNIDPDFFAVGYAPDLPDIPSSDDLTFYKHGIYKSDEHGIYWSLAERNKNRASLNLRKCYLKARQARFEHGETPR